MMINKKAGLVSVLLMLCFALPVCAEVRDFDFLSIDIPEGWTVEQQGASMIVIKAESSDASLSLAMASKGQASFDEIANKLCEQLNGFELEKDDEGDYSFSYNDTAGVENFMYVVDGENDLYIISSSHASGEKDSDAINAMIESAGFNFGEEYEYDDNE